MNGHSKKYWCFHCNDLVSEEDAVEGFYNGRKAMFCPDHMAKLARITKEDDMEFLKRKIDEYKRKEMVKV